MCIRDSIKSTISSIQQDIEDIQEQISDILARIQSITYVPKYSDGKAVMTYTDNGTITPGTAEFDFEVKPATAADEIAKLWSGSTGSTAITVKAVYTITRSAPETVALTVESVTADGGFITVTVNGKALKDEFFMGKCSANARLGISDGNNDIISEYVQLTPVKNISFADSKFKSYCVENFDSDGDGELTDEEAATVTKIECSSRGLTSLTGIEYFSNLEYIDVSCNSLTALDLSHSPKLETLDASSTGLSGIDLAKNTALKSLSLNSCSAMTTIDLSANTALETLSLSSTPLSSLDVSNNSSLATLDVSSTVKLIVSKGLKSSIYKVGQYVSIAGCTGIVYQTSSPAIVSTDETTTTWDYFGTSTGATSSDDGVSNTNKIASDSSAAKWCREKGAEWYLPALNELKVIYNNMSTLNTTLSSIGGTQFNASGYYWSSAESSSYYAYRLHFSSGSSYDGGKYSSFEVRAVRAL